MDKQILAVVVAAALAGAGAIYVSFLGTQSKTDSIGDRIPLFHEWMRERDKRIEGNTRRIERLEDHQIGG